jgi:hypothetical protein
MTQSNEYRLAHVVEDILAFIRDIYKRLKTLEEAVSALEEETK